MNGLSQSSRDGPYVPQMPQIFKQHAELTDMLPFFVKTYQVGDVKSSKVLPEQTNNPHDPSDTRLVSLPEDQDCYAAYQSIQWART